MARLVCAERRVMLIQINTLYNDCEQKSISECTAISTLRWMDSNSRIPHLVPHRLLHRVTLTGQTKVKDSM